MKENWIESLRSWSEEKTNSRVLIYYFAVTNVFNWKISYTIFFQSSETLHLPKVIFIEKFLLVSNNDLVNVFWHFGIPAFITAFVVVLLPKISKLALEYRLEEHFGSLEAYNDREKVYEERKSKNLQQIATEKEKQVDSLETIFKNTSNEEKWEMEYKKFQDILKPVLISVSDIIYNNSGHTHRRDGVRSYQAIPAEILARAEAFELIDFNDNRDQISYTKKGLYLNKMSSL